MKIRSIYLIAWFLLSTLITYATDPDLTEPVVTDENHIPFGMFIEIEELKIRATKTVYSPQKEAKWIQKRQSLGYFSFRGPYPLKNPPEKIKTTLTYNKTLVSPEIKIEITVPFKDLSLAIQHFNNPSLPFSLDIFDPATDTKALAPAIVGRPFIRIENQSKPKIFVPVFYYGVGYESDDSEYFSEQVWLDEIPLEKFSERTLSVSPAVVKKRNSFQWKERLAFIRAPSGHGFIPVTILRVITLREPGIKNPEKFAVILPLIPGIHTSYVFPINFLNFTHVEGFFEYLEKTKGRFYNPVEIMDAFSFITHISREKMERMGQNTKYLSNPAKISQSAKIAFQTAKSDSCAQILSANSSARYFLPKSTQIPSKEK